MIPHWFDSIGWSPPHAHSGIGDEPSWDGSIQPEATLLVWHHRGSEYGDYFHFSRYLELAAVRVKRLVVHCDVRLVRLVRLMRGVSEVSSWDQRTPDYDVQCPVLALPKLLTTPDQIPPPALVQVSLPSVSSPWLRRLKGCPRPWIGVCWQGGRMNPMDCYRSFSQDLFSILADAGMNLISIQKRELVSNPRIRDLGPDYQRGDWLNTAVTLRHLDRVIGPETALLHLAGSLGIPAWLVLAIPTDWRWFPAEREDGQVDDSRTPWYPSMRVFRQETAGEWIPVFQKMAEVFTGE
jgi:hypothetical protein